MPYFGEKSLSVLSTCCEELKQIAGVAIKGYGFAVVVGKRGKIEQNRLFDIGLSKKKYPKGKHNCMPSDAFDIIPDEGGWFADPEQFILMAGIIKGIALALGYIIRWGGDWDSDNDLKDQSFYDLAHFEIIRK